MVLCSYNCTVLHISEDIIRNFLILPFFFQCSNGHHWQNHGLYVCACTRRNRLLWTGNCGMWVHITDSYDIICAWSEAYPWTLLSVNASQKTKSSVKRQAGIAPDLTQIVEASQQMESMLDTILSYVEDVLAGRTAPDNTFGRSLLDMIHSVPKMSAEDFEDMLNSNRKVSDFFRVGTEF